MKQITSLKCIILPFLLLAITFIMPFTAFTETNTHIWVGYDKESRNLIITSISVALFGIYTLINLISIFSKKLSKKANSSIISIIPLVISFSLSAPYVFTLNNVVGSSEFKQSLLVVILTSMLIIFDVSLSISIFTISNLSLKMQNLKLSKVSAETGEVTDEYYVGGAFNEYSTFNSLELKTKVNKMQEGLKKSTSEIINEIEKTGEFAGISLSKEQKVN